MLTGVVLAHNEAQNLPDCLKSLTFCDRLILVDDHSSDKSADIAWSFHAKVIRRSLQGDFAAQRNYALDHVSSGWVLFIDADERISPQLADEIRRVVLHSPLSAYTLHRQDILWNKQMHHGDCVTDLIRLGKFDCGRWAGRVHETWQVGGSVGRLNSPLLHYPHTSVADFLRHINFYSSLRASELFSTQTRSHSLLIIFKPLGKFMYLYLIKLGFLDGIPGLISALMMSFYSFLVQGKLYLLYRGISDSHA